MNVVEPGGPPPLELAVEGMLVPEGADRTAQEVAHLAPASTERTPRERKAQADVELPEGSRKPPGNAELEGRDYPARAHDARELRHRRTRVAHVPKEVGDGQVVEGGVLEGQVLRGRLDQRDGLAEPAACLGQHLGAAIDSRDLVPVADELGGDQPRSRRDVEHVAARWDARDEEPSPARILAERERGADAVVGRPERREQLLGVDRAHAPILGDVALVDELERIRALAGGLIGPGDMVSGILAAEPAEHRRTYVCSVDDADGLRSWLALHDDGTPVTARADLRAAVSIAAMCEVAAEAAGGGDVDELVASLAQLRAREAPEGIDQAEAAARELRAVLGEPPQLATPARLDAIGAATRRLEQELSPNAPSPFVAAMRASEGVVGELQREVEAGYRVPLES